MTDQPYDLAMRKLLALQARIAEEQFAPPALPAPEKIDLHVTLPEMIVHLPPANVNVPPANVNVPPPAATVKQVTFTRGEDGRIESAQVTERPATPTRRKRNV